MQAGAVTDPLASSTLKMARLTGEPTPAWRTEGAATADQAMVFDAVTFTAQSLAILVKCSFELFEDAAPLTWCRTASPARSRLRSTSSR